MKRIIILSLTVCMVAALCGCGMSTACENIALKQMNMKVLSISCITDYCSNVDNDGTTHEEVLKNAEKASSEFVSLVKTIVKKL